MMDYGKYKYDLSVKARESRKKQTRNVVKEVQFRPKIGKADFDVKKKRVVKFLRQGDKVKCTMRFRGREVAHPELGRVILQRLFEDIEDYAEIDIMPRLDGRNMVMVLAPGKSMPVGDHFGDREGEHEYQIDDETDSSGDSPHVDFAEPEAPVTPTAEVEEEEEAGSVEPIETATDDNDGETADDDEADTSAKSE
jgi:translation initiation factor IF-3